MMSFCPRSVAQIASKSEIEAWFEREWAAAQAMPDLGDCSIAWNLEFWSVPPEDEIARLRESVAGKPDHPGRRELERIDRCLLGDPPVLARRVWARSAEAWRSNTTFERGGFIDSSMSPKFVWQLGHAQLTIGDLAEADGSMADVRSELYTFWPELGRLLFGGLSDGAISGMTRGTLQWDGSLWTVTLAFGPPDKSPALETEISGRWDPALARGFVVGERVVTNTVRPADIGSELVYDEWKYIEALGRWVASRVEERAPDGGLQRAYVFVDAWKGSPGEFEQVVAVPKIDADDPVRGRPTFTRLVDYRNGTLRDREGNGETFNRALPLSDRPEARAWHRWLGWVTAAALLGGLIAIRLRRRTSP